MRETGGVAEGFGFGLGDIDVVARREHHGVVGDFVIIESSFSAGSEPGIERQLRDGAMIAVLIDGPLSEDDVGSETGEELVEG